MTPNSSSPNLPAYSSFHSTRAHTPPFNLSHTTTAVDAPCVTSKSLFDIRVVKIKGVNMASNVCLSFSDITYVYPFLVTQKLDQESAMASWKANFQRNLVGRVPALVSLEAKFGSGAGNSSNNNPSKLFQSFPSPK